MSKAALCVIHCFLAALAVSCASPPPLESAGDARGAASPETTADLPASPGTPTVGTIATEEVDAARRSAVTVRDSAVLGSGVFVRNESAAPGGVQAAEGGVTLNFEKASLSEFMRVIFETILDENYLIDPGITGSVTLHTTRPIARASVIPIVEAVLEQNGAALVRDDGVFRVVALANAEGSAGSPAVGRFPSTDRYGYGIQVVPLEHVSAAEIEKILGPFVPEGSSMRSDRSRNVLILSGPQYRLDDLMATVRTFDVDWLKGMSFAMIPLEYADAESIVEELETVLTAEGESPLAGIVRLLPIERLNAVLVITHRPDHIASVKKLVEQFDWGLEGASGRRLYVYELESGIADKIAGVLQQVFGQARTNGGVGDQLATPISQSSPFRSASSVSQPPPAPGRMNSGRRPQTAVKPATDTQSDDGTLAESESDVMIIADQENNAILVMATQQDYRAIESAIRRLDVPPRQVLIEATIAEVTLSDALTYGVRWFIEKSDWQLGFNAPVPSTASGAGLALAFFDRSSDLKAFFDVLGTESSVKFLSTPQLMVLNNQTANIRVGDQIPVTTRSAQSTTDPEAPIVSEVQYRDTGTLLTVTPGINAGGQITLDISQEVSVPGTEPAVGGGGNVSIAQRTINSSVIVHDGQTVVLGGLIRETTSDGKSGIPLLMDLPLLGRLFSTTTEDTFRTELIISVRPVVVENQIEMRKVTDELRDRMARANEYEQAVRASGSKR